jgi:hypothetical protein
VRVISPLPAASSEADADRRLEDLVSRVVPDLARFVPN